MSRRTDNACEMEWKHFGGGDYLVVAFSAAALSDVCLGLCMMKEQLLPSIELGSTSKKATLSICRQSGSAAVAEVRRASGRTTLRVGETDLEVLLHFFLRTIRDGSAEVDHVDVDAVAENGTATSVVLKFPAHAAPVSADEVRRRLGI